jgi:hypothetical protein
MKTARVCLAALPIAASASGAQFANPDGNLVLLQTHAAPDNLLGRQLDGELSTADGRPPKD